MAWLEEDNLVLVHETGSNTIILALKIANRDRFE